MDVQRFKNVTMLMFLATATKYVLANTHTGCCRSVEYIAIVIPAYHSWYWRSA